MTRMGGRLVESMDGENWCLGIKTDKHTRHDSIYEISHCRVWPQKGMKYSVIGTAGAGEEGLQTMGIMES
jgi:hypothetical protein